MKYYTSENGFTVRNDSDPAPKGFKEVTEAAWYKSLKKQSPSVRDVEAMVREAVQREAEA